MNEYAALVCGSRNLREGHYPFFKRTLDDIFAAKGGLPSKIVHGGAAGGDAHASRYAFERKINLEIFGAQWRSLGTKAGPLRNQTMLQRMYHDDVVVGFLLAGSRGARHMLDIALRGPVQLDVHVIDAPEIEQPKPIERTGL